MSVAVGSIWGGKVTGLSAFGAFVKLETGDSGLVHISEVSNEFVEDIKSVLKIGQDVKVKVIGIDDKSRIKLSIKKASVSKPASKQPAIIYEKPKPQNLSFEEMMSRFKQESDDKLSDFKAKENRRSHSKRSK